MSLSNRDRAKVNAALVLLHDAGHDTGEVTRLAQSIINTGTPTRQAYERAFNSFVERAPSMMAPLSRLGQLIEATDNRTLASYSVALSRYIETGDRSSLEAILPTVQADMKEMAVRTGDAGFADGLEDSPPAATETKPEQPTEALETSPAPARPGHGPTGYSPSTASPTADNNAA